MGTAGENGRCVFCVGFVDEQACGAGEDERVGASGVVGCDHGRDSRRFEHRLSKLCVASRGVSADLDHWQECRVSEDPSPPSDALVDTLALADGDGGREETREQTRAFDWCHALKKRRAFMVQINSRRTDVCHDRTDSGHRNPPLHGRRSR
jgi:hypothetical protein